VSAVIREQRARRAGDACARLSLSRGSIRTWPISINHLFRARNSHFLRTIDCTRARGSRSAAKRRNGTGENVSRKSILTCLLARNRRDAGCRSERIAKRRAINFESLRECSSAFGNFTRVRQCLMNDKGCFPFSDTSRHEHHSIFLNIQ